MEKILDNFDTLCVDDNLIGIKEKILAAKRAKIKEIILCQDNKKNIDEIDSSYLKGLNFHYVSNMKQVLDIAITNQNVKNYKNLNVK